jgi:purine nucleosidase
MRDFHASVKKIIIDTDPGQDDAVAILYWRLAAQKTSRVLGITAVAGNVPLALTQKMPAWSVNWLNDQISKSFAGCERPLAHRLVTAEHVHGKTGLDGPNLPDPTMPLQDQHAVDFIIDTAAQPQRGVSRYVLWDR